MSSNNNIPVLKSGISSSASSVPPSAGKHQSGSKSAKSSHARYPRTWVPDSTGKYVQRTSKSDFPMTPQAPETDYDPYKHRPFKDYVNNFGTLQHIVRGSVGLGVFSYPKGFYHTGFIGATLGTIFFGFIVSYGMNMLSKTSHLLSKRKRVGRLAFGDAMQCAMEEGPDWMIRWSKQSKLMVNAFLTTSQILFCSIYTIATANLMKAIIDDFYCDKISVRLLMCMLYPATFLMTSVPNLRVFAYFSMLGNALMYTSFAVISYYIFIQEPSPEPRKIFGQPSEWFSFVDISLFSLQSIGVHTIIEQHMARPQDFYGFFGIMNMGVMIVCVTYWFMGFCGYWVYGEQVKDSVLSHLLGNSMMVRWMRVLHCFAMLINYSLNSFLVMDIIWTAFFFKREEGMSEKKQTLYHYALIIGYTFLVLIVALTLMDYIGVIISFSGFVEVSMLIVGFPAMMQLCFLWPDNFGRYNWILYKDIGLFISSVVLCVCGFYYVVLGIMAEEDEAVVSCATRNVTGS